VWLESAEQRTDRVALSKALEALHPAASRANASGETLALYGRALFLAGQTESSAGILQAAADARPVEPVAFLWLSAARERRGEVDAARQALLDYATLIGVEDLDTLLPRVTDSLRLQQRLRAPISRRREPADAA
jgi:predicted Zn-dependent protease